MSPRTDTRARMITSAALMLGERGFAGTSFASVIEDSNAPRGSISHHFPGGKREMVVDAVRWAGGTATSGMRRALEQGSSAPAILSLVCDFYRKALVDTGFARGCPVGAVAQEAYADPELRAAVAEVIEEWRAVLAKGIAAGGRDAAEADDLADLCISAVEGALILCRIEASIEPLNRVERQVAPLLR